MTVAPTCSAPFPPRVDPTLITARFDLDGSDAIGPELRFLIPPNQPLAAPLQPSDLGGAVGCIHADPYLLISFNDDWAAHYSWNGCPVPSETTSDSGFTYGADAQDDEVLMVTTTPIWPPSSGFPKVLLGATSPVLAEAALHPNLPPSPDPALSQQFDDDVDALDVNLGAAPCGTWSTAVYHEATGLHPAIPGMPLDPGDIYEVLALGGVTKVIDHAIHLGLPNGTDITGFEFIWLRRCDPGNPTSCQDRLTLIFSVNEDDFLTPQDESGGLNPRMIYASFMTDEDGNGAGDHFEYLSGPLRDNVDAIAASPLPFVAAGPLPPPPNDTCGTAMTVLPGSTTFTNFGATTDGPPEPCGFSGLPGQDSDVWFLYIAPCTGLSIIAVAPAPASPPDRLLAVYPSCPTAGGPPPMVCASAPGAVSGVVQHVAGQTLIIRAGMPGGQQGDSTLDITVTCACPEDITGNLTVDVDDLIAVILAWGPCPAGTCPPHCPADVAPLGPPQGNCQVDVDDLIAVILAWGPCP